MCDLVDRVVEGNSILYLDGIPRPVMADIWLSTSLAEADDGITYPVACRHKIGPGYTEWEILPEPGPDQAIHVPPDSELVMGIIVDGQFRDEFTDKQFDEWRAATLTTPS